MIESRYRTSGSSSFDRKKKSWFATAFVAVISFVPYLIFGALQVSFLWLSGTPISRGQEFDGNRKKQSLLSRILLFPLRLILLPLFLLWHPVRSSLGLQSKPRERRRWGNLIWGLPAFLLAITTLVAMVMMQTRAASLPDAYRVAAIDAQNNLDVHATEIYLQRLMRLDTDDEEMQFNFAKVLEAKGEMGRALAIMSSLAPDDKVGYPPAHLWLAKWTLSSPDATDADRLSCRHHLEIAANEFPKQPEVLEQLAALHLFLARVEPSANHLSTAIDYLKHAAELKPELYYQLARVQLDNEQFADASESFVRAERYFRLELSDDKHNQDARLGLARSLSGLSRFDEARTLLEEGIALDESQQFKALLAETIVAIVDQRYEREGGFSPEIFGMLIEAMRFNPKSTSVGGHLLDYGITTTDLNDRDVAIQMLESYLAEGEGVAMAHLLLGVHYFTNVGDADISMFHLEAAFNLDPTLTDSANNLAWLLAHRDPPDYERALAVINSVLEEHPEDANYLDTRGHIYLAMERWRDAAKDLERALPQMNNNPGTHAALAQIYEHFGQTSLAARHRSLAASLQGAGGSP